MTPRYATGVTEFLPSCKIAVNAVGNNQVTRNLEGRHNGTPHAPHRNISDGFVTRIDVLFHDGGGGHRNAATSLKLVIEQQQRNWDVRLVNFQSLLDPLDILRKATGIRIQEMYNKILRNGWTLGSTQLLRVLQATIRVYHRAILELLKENWRESRPDMVVSVIPHFNRAICESLRLVVPSAPFVTILTDLADFPPRFWLERQEQFVICGSERAVHQAKEMGHGAEHVFRVSGMILHPRFYEAPREGRESLRASFGLRPGVPAALVLFGGYGSKAMWKIAEQLNQSNLELQLLLICGRNEALVEELRAHQWRFLVHIEGYTTRVNEFMRAADFFIGKPGPGSISEALAMELPVIVESNAWTLPQERYNAEWVVEEQLGIVLKSFDGIVPAVTRMLEPGNLAKYRANASALKNRAVFEIPDTLAQILGESSMARIPPMPAVAAQI